MVDGTTVGIWIPEGESLMDEFDEQFGHDPAYSRSKKIKDAMRLYIQLDRILDREGISPPDERSKQAFIRQVLLEHGWESWE